jgi:hypothetical protein
MQLTHGLGHPRRRMWGKRKNVNVAQQELVRATFARLAVMPEVAGALFHERLFATNPRFRALFKNDMPFRASS